MQMNGRTWRVMPMLIVAAMLAAAGEGAAMAGTGATVLVAKSSRIWLEGDSTLHRFKADAAQFQARVSVDETARSAGLYELVSANRVKSLAIEIPVSQLQSGDGGLDENMVKALKGNAHPSITFRMDSYQFLPESSAGESAVKLHGRLLVAGVEKSIELEAKATRTDSGLRIVGSKALLMSEYGIQPPVMMLGALKVKDTIVVKFVLELQPG